MRKYSRLIRSLLVSLQTILTSINFWIAVVLLFGVLFAEISEDVFSGFWKVERDGGFNAAYFFNIALHFSYFIYAAPLICAFAASGNLVNDVEAGYYRHRLLFSGRKEYQYGLYIGSTIGGGLALLTPVILFACVCAALYSTEHMVDEMAVMNGWTLIVTTKNANWNYMILCALLSFLFGMVWSGVGLTISIYSPNRYVSYVSPFIVCFASVLILPPSLQPLEMLVQMNWTSFTFAKLLMYQTILYLIIMIWFRHVFERRIVHGQD